MYTFPKLIKQIRKESGLTQDEFAKKIGVSTILISMIETGQKEVSKDFIKKLSAVLKVHPSTLAPFIFANNYTPSQSSSPLEKRLIKIGSDMQSHLIEVKSQNLSK